MGLALFLGLVLAAPTGQDLTPVGEPVHDLAFKTVLGGDGRVRPSEFRGQPVLIVWYSTVFAGMSAARIAVDLDEKHAKDGLVVFLMEIKNNDATYLRALQMAKLPGVTCPLIRNQELRVEFDASTGFPPKMVLVGVDGTLLYAGSYQRASEVKKLLKKELKKVKGGWGEDPVAKKARALAHGKQRLGAAWVLLQPGLDGDGASEELRAVARVIRTRFDTWKRSVGHLAKQGEPGRALAAAQGLVLASEGNDEWVAAAAELVASFETPEAARELELGKKLEALLKPLRSKGPKKGFDRKLRSFADGAASGTPVGERAARLADAVAFALEEKL